MENFNICQHDEFCGGCIYQGVPYEEQLAVKEAEVKNIFAEKEDRECFMLCISSFSPIIVHGFLCGYKVVKSSFLFSEQVCSYNFSLKVFNRIYAFETTGAAE